MPHHLTIDQALHAASAFRAGGQRDAAENMCRQILAAHPTHPNALHLIGVIAGEAGRYEESIAYLSKALPISATPEICLSDIGTAYLRTDRFEEAVNLFQRALAVRPGMADTHNNLAEALWRSGKIEEAIRHCQSAIRIAPNHSGAQANLGPLLLLCGDYESGLSVYEWRIRHGIVSSSAIPRWSDEHAPGATLLVRSEQGIGDTIQFLRYLPAIREASGASRMILEVPQSLVRLIEQSGDGIAEIVVAGADLPSCDYHLPLMSAPFALKQHEPQGMLQPYLRAEQRGGLDSAGLRVGLAWAGNPSHSRDRQRSITPGLLAPVLNIAGATFYSLQMGQPAPEGATDLTSGIADFADTAALMAQLDLIITVDTAAAHLVGALGRPVWTLLPFVPDWRWGLESETTPWYPTMRLFRQKTAGDWGEVIGRVAAELRALVASR